MPPLHALFGSALLATSAFAQTTVEIHDNLADTAANLEPGGVHYSLAYVEDDFENLTGGILSLLEEMPASGNMTKAETDALLDYLPTLFRELGLYNLRTKGASTTPIHEEAWHNRTYWGHKGRKHLIGLLGQEVTAWQAPTFATADADIVLELSLDTRGLVPMVDKLLAELPDEKAREKGLAEFRKTLKQPLFPGSPMTIGETLAAANVRGSLVITLDVGNPWQPEPDGPKLPGFDITARLDGVAPLLPIFEQSLGKMLPKSEVEGLAVYSLPQAIPAPMGKIQPTFVHDATNDSLWLRLNGSPLDVLPDSANSLAQSEAFTAAMTDFPEKGSALAYVSDEFLSVLVNLIKESPDMPAEGSKLIEKFASEVRETNFGLSAGIASQENGLLFTANLPFAKKGGSILANPFLTTGVFAAIGAPAAQKAIEKSRAKADEGE